MALTQRKRKLIEALHEYYGIITPACKAAHVSRKTYYNWCKADPEFKIAADEALDIALDFVESRLFDNIKSGNVLSQMFYLKCRGKERGYIEKTESDISGNLNLGITKRIITEKIDDK